MRALLRSWGTGAQLYLIIGLLVAACPDSRMSTLVWPLVVTTLVLAFERAGFTSKGLVVSMGVLGLLMSRIWLPFNIPSSTEETGWDMSRYFETQGTFMTEPYYLTGLALGGLILLLLSMKLPPRPKRRALAQGKSGHEEEAQISKDV